MRGVCQRQYSLIHPASIGVFLQRGSRNTKARCFLLPTPRESHALTPLDLLFGRRCCAPGAAKSFSLFRRRLRFSKACLKKRDRCCYSGRPRPSLGWIFLRLASLLATQYSGFSWSNRLPFLRRTPAFGLWSFRNTGEYSCRLS